jgi:hypothetical protein
MVRPCSSVHRSLEVLSVSKLERPTLANLYCHRTEIRSNPVQVPYPSRGADWVETTDDTGEIMLVSGLEVPNSRNGINPNLEEREEGYGAIYFG